MLKKISAVARVASILLAVVAGFVALGDFDIALALVLLGLVSGLSMPTERMTGVGVAIIVLPMLGAALMHIPQIGTNLDAIAGNLALGTAGALSSAIVLYLCGMVRDDLTGLTKAS